MLKYKISKEVQPLKCSSELHLLGSLGSRLLKWCENNIYIYLICDTAKQNFTTY